MYNYAVSAAKPTGTRNVQAKNLKKTAFGDTVQRFITCCPLATCIVSAYDKHTNSYYPFTYAPEASGKKMNVTWVG